MCKKDLVFGFDFGTSPVDRTREHQKTRPAVSPLSLVDGFGLAATGNHA